jgi:hypothetical protein
MFRNTNDFFEEVAQGNLTSIDIKNYVKKITNNHTLEDLKTLKKDFDFFKYLYREEIESNITTELINEKIKEYNSKGLKIPTTTTENFINKTINERNKNKELDEENITTLNLEKIFYPFEMFTLYQFENYINSLLEKNMNRDENIFFEQVFSGNVNDTDISNFVYIVTDEEPHKLFLLKRELMFFIMKKEDELFKKISNKDIKEKILEYEKNGQEVPMKTWLNHIGKKLNKRNENKVFEEEDKGIDIEKMFFPNELFQIKQLENYIESLINKKKSIDTNQKTKHENIFSNNGFVLFEHILKEYVKTKRGRLSDIHFFYWSMYNNKPQYIHQRPERFREWFFENYNEDLGQIKQPYQIENPDRLKHYSNALDWFKTQK